MPPQFAASQRKQRVLYPEMYLKSQIFPL